MLNSLLNLLFNIVNWVLINIVNCFLISIPQKIDAPCTLVNLFTTCFLFAWKGLDIGTSKDIFFLEKFERGGGLI